ncbi:shikimate dehydrogenase [Actinomyces sp. 432]|uniref:shikimate dehydrogenase n=1 Tax=Actinomyces sp. 432 TaxID=2057798 RepID=UPI00137406B0|nr:shikimate dehydrogenase [Actinomyces sp. 432]QHO90935.1 shikimate dehydrogenase [Actinomyces sp. 432]
MAATGPAVGPVSAPARARGHRAAVIGSPVAHSLSPVLHRAAYAALGLDDWTYERRETTPADLPALLEELAAPAAAGPVWAGVSVTMPHKQALLPRLDVVDPLAATVGAVNTVVAQRSGRGAALLVGFNTDVAGIVGAMREAGAGTAGGVGGRAEAGTGAGRCRAVLLGSGATACSALAALTELGATDITVAARRHAGPGRALTAAHRMGLEVTALHWRPGDAASDAEVAGAAAQADLLVSTLPAGAADTLAAPLAAALSGAYPRAGAVMLDVVYAPWPTPLARAWARASRPVAPGWLMLLHQAVPQVTLMTGRTPELAPLRRELEAALADRAGVDTAGAAGADVG